MTLAVARKIGGTAWIAVDSLITSKNSDIRQPEYQLKTFKIDAVTLVTFAGSSDYALPAIDAVTCDARTDLETIAEELLARTPDADVDFILMRGGSISVIRNGHIEFDVPAAWIGNKPAFEHYQEVFHRAAPRAAEAPSTQILITGDASHVGERDSAQAVYEAMNHVATNPEHWSVGGPVTLSFSSQSASNYLSFFEHVSFGAKQFRSSGWHAEIFGSAASGDHSYTTITPNVDEALSAWGYFHHQGHSGTVFIADPHRSLRVKVVGQASNAQDFCETVRQEYGYALRHCGSVGG